MIVWSELARQVVRLVHDGDPLAAFDLARRSREQWDDALEAAHALVLDRLGHARRAEAALTGLARRNPDDEEVLSNLASIQKRHALALPDGNARREQLQIALATYERAYDAERTRRYWPLVNVATLRRLLGEHDAAANTAREVLRLIDRLPPADGDEHETTWRLATRAEAHVVAGDMSSALAGYAEVRRSALRADGHWEPLASARRNLTALRAVLTPAADEAMELLRSPPVALFVGHRIDHDRRPEDARFPVSMVHAVESALRNWMLEREVRIGFSALADGGDVLFQRALRSVDGERHVILPFDVASFRDLSVGSSLGMDWDAEFDALRTETARTLSLLGQISNRQDVGLEFGNRVMEGLACLRADAVGAEVARVVLWDGRLSDAPGGTGNTMRRWRDAGHEVVVVDPGSATTRYDVRTASSGGGGATPGVCLSEPHVEAFLLADVKGYSRLGEDSIRWFVEEYMGRLAGALEPLRHAMTVCETWGDAVFAAFRDVESAGCAALAIRDAAREIESEERESDLAARRDLRLRVGLHAGPAEIITDPVTGRARVAGAEVSVVACIEPIVPPGDVFASEAFAALAREEGVRSFRCRFAGTNALAKAAGHLRTYRVVRAAPELGTSAATGGSP